jgi:hypothetical protein
MRLVTPPYLPLVATVPRGTPVSVELAPEVREALGADGASLGAVSVKADGANPRSGGDAGGLLWDRVMRGTGISASGTVAYVT